MWAWLEHEATKFWIAVSVGLALKFSFSEKVEGLTPTQSRKRFAAGVIAGGAVAYYGTDHVVSYFSIGPESYLLTAIGLTITGEHIVRTFVEKGPAIASSIVASIIRAFSKDESDKQ